MPVFLEKYLLPITVALTVLVMFTNPMGLDWNQRISGGLALLLVAYFVGHTVHKTNEARKTAEPKLTLITPPAQSSAREELNRRIDVVQQPSPFAAEQTGSMRIVPLTYSGIGLLNRPPPVRPQRTAITKALYVDCIVSQLNEVFFVDLRVANEADTPLLISAAQVRARQVKKSVHKEWSALSDHKVMLISEAYDIDLSNLRKASDVVSEPLAQAIEPKATDRFVLRLSVRPPVQKQDIRIVFDVEIITSVGIILIEKQVGVFGSSLKLSSTPYFDELNAIAERRSGATR